MLAGKEEEEEHYIDDNDKSVVAKLPVPFQIKQRDT
jgi:hypothetical protein